MGDPRLVMLATERLVGESLLESGSGAMTAEDLLLHLGRCLKSAGVLSKEQSSYA
jgi:hypothetical protein